MHIQTKRLMVAVLLLIGAYAMGLSDQADTGTPVVIQDTIAGPLDERYRYNEKELQSFLTWIKEAIQGSKKSKESVIIVDKADHSLYLIRGTDLIEWFPVELGGYNIFDAKTKEYDGCTPEGKYKVIDLKEGTRTKYYKALLFDYPNADDRARFSRLKREGIIPMDAGIGGVLEIHGGGTGFAGNHFFGKDWTAGCVALANTYMDRLWPHVRVGTPVIIVRYGIRAPVELLPGVPNLAEWKK